LTLAFHAGINVYGSFDYLREFTPRPVQSIEAVCCALAKNAVDIRPGMIIVFRYGCQVLRSRLQ
jgi:pyruvate kinase